MTLSIVCVIIIGFETASMAQAGIGKVAGSIIDSETGEPIPGATIFLEKTTMGTSSDLDGHFAINRVPVGEYTLAVSMIGYAKTFVNSVIVTENGIAKVSLSLKSDAIAVDNIVVEAKSLQNTEAALLKERQKSNAVSDAISAEAFSKLGSGDAAEAMSRVTGASVVGGKYVLVRGLGDRYSNAQLNGAELPSADPDKKAFQMDLLPTNLLENIVTIKSFTPDQPGSFSGGIIDIGTKTYPESFTMKFSTSGSSIKGTTGDDHFLTYGGGDQDWLGMDDGGRDIPNELQDPSVVIPDVGSTFRDSANAHELDRLSKSFNNTMGPTNKTAPWNRNFVFSMGNQASLFGRPFGYLGSLSYNRSYSSYENGKYEKWILTSTVEHADSLAYLSKLIDNQGTDEVLWGGLAMTSFKPHPRHEIAANFLYTQSGESSARYLTGVSPDKLPEDALYETRVLKYTERNLQSFQLRGQHSLKDILGLEMEWMGSMSKNTQDEPDMRFFSNHLYIQDYGTYAETTYAIGRSYGYTPPERYFRNLKEDNSQFDVKFSLPFRQWSGLSSKFKFGGSYNEKDREFRERIFEYQNGNYNQYGYDGDPYDYFDDTNVGIMDSTNGFYRFANYIVETTAERGNYDGHQYIGAGYAMVEMPLSRKLRFAGGVRAENTHIDVVTHDTTLAQGRLRNYDNLPSANLIYQLSGDMNLRAAYGRTLARPTFRELAPYASWEFVNGYYFIGNADLKRTLIDNYDMRWEWFIRPGEIYAVSGFFKEFHSPIERAIKNENGEIGYQNVDYGQVYGVELELRRKLDRIHRLLGNFQLGANISFTHSRVTIPEAEMNGIRAADSTADNHRPLWGQSPYIVNVDLAYDNLKTRTSATISYNIAGKRLSEVSLGGTPDVYELPSPTLNFILTQELLYKFSVKFSARNMLGSDVHKVHQFKGNDYTFQQYERDRSFSIGISYDIK
jgi:TonB-dependent receptor